MLQVELPVVDALIRGGEIRTLKLPNGELRLDPRSVQDFLRAIELDVRTHYLGVIS